MVTQTGSLLQILIASKRYNYFSHVIPAKPTEEPSPIAIVGMGMRLPGGCHDAQTFWDFLLNKKEGMVPVPSSRWDLQGFHDDSGRAGTIKAKEGNFLDIDLGAFDAQFFSMTPSAIEQADPQQRIFLETVYESLENAGEKNIKGRNIGVYVGLFAEDWIEMHSKDSEPLGFFGLTGHIDLMNSNLVSYEFDWTGPSMTFKTGCSASMVALDTACKAIARGDCESAIVGGTNLILSPGLSMILSKYGVNSPDGRCRSFDADALGYGRGEAVSSLYIKRLDDAIRDGNPIRGVIRATLCNDDGKTPGITQPNTHAHESLIRKTYSLAGLADKHHETGFFECHGTGTPVGDPIEVNAVARVFGKAGMVIGSVKSNVGHSEAGSGNTSIIKSILALEHRIIPPNVNFNTPNPKIPWKDAKLTVPTEPLSWPADRQERVSINSFGIGGSNAHVILESARSHGVRGQMVSASMQPRLSFLPFSAKSAESLQASLDKYSQYLEKRGNACLHDLAYTLGNRRVHYEHRTFAITDGSEGLESEPTTHISIEDSSVVFVFTGQGAQWAEMGKQLMDDFASVRDGIVELDKILSKCHFPPTWKIYEELRKPKRNSQIHKAEFSQPLCTAVQIILVDLLRSWGITPAAVVGHSSGEIAAAYTTGSLSKADAILAAYFRGVVTRNKLVSGTMAAVGLCADAVRRHLIEGVVIGCENSPNSTTISGDIIAVESVMESLKREIPDVFVRPLQVANAYHSHQMKAYGAAYEQSIREVTSEGLPTIPLFSSVTGKRYKSPGVFNASYWRRNLENPVLFHTAVRNLIHADFKNLLLVEIGPHSALAGPLRQIFQSENKSYAYVHSLLRGRDDTQSMYECIGSLWCHNVPVNFEVISPPGRVLTDLPAYSWDHSKSYWQESRMCREWRKRKFLPHETLGTRLPGTSQLEPTWRNIASLEKAPWIRDHVVGTDVVFPGAGYIAMAGEAIRQLTGQSDYSVRSLAIKTAMIFTGKEIDVITAFKRAKLTSKDDTDWWEFRVTSFNGSTWNEHCSGQAKAGPIYSNDRIPPGQPYHLRKVRASRWYGTMQRIGFTYGPEFCGMEDITVDPITSEATANITVPTRESPPYELHPCEIDKILQLLTVTQHQGEPSLFKQLAMPTYFDEVYVGAGHALEIRATAISHLDHMDTWTGSAFGTSGDKIVFELNNLSVSPMGASKDTEEKLKNAVELVWQPDVEFAYAKDFIRTPLDISEDLLKLEVYYFVLALEMLPIIANIQTKASHLVKFRDWLTRSVQETSSGNNKFVLGGPEIALLNFEARQVLLEKMETDLMTSRVAAAATALRRIHLHARALYDGTIDALDILMEGDILTQIYAFFDQNWDYSSLISAIGHKKPTLRILEVGAGTGGTTSNLLHGLISQFDEQLYSKYTYTDISPGFFVAAKERFKDYNGLEFQVLDISQCPIQQGFQEGSYDLILAANVLHATPNIQETLKNVRKLLHPQGQLILQELDMQAKWMNFIMGCFPGWWLGEDDGRPNEPYISPERWDHELKASGFAGTGSVVLDNEHPYQVCATMVVKAYREPVENNAVTFLYADEITQQVKSIQRGFEAAGHTVTPISFSNAVSLQQDTICLLELERPFVNEICKGDFDKLMKLLSGLGNKKIVWLTRSCSMRVTDPRFAQTLGLARTFRSEKHIDFTTLEINDINHCDIPSKVVQIYEKTLRPDQDSDLDPDFEFAIENGIIYIPRFHWYAPTEALHKSAPEVTDKVLMIGQKGMIDSLQWEENWRVQRSLRIGEVLIEPHFVGINFKDVLQTQGVVDGNDLGSECSATILEVGPGVTEFKPGDRVFAVGSYCFSNKLITNQDLLAKIPDGLSMEGAGTMGIVFTTAIYALCHLRPLKKGQTILIHSACGAVGIAAMQLAQMIGAKIFATVGSPEKVQYLMDAFDIPRDQIFDSHSNSFVKDVLARTSGKGVDIALNSLAGELLHSTWRCIAPFGAMIEIGKRDFYGHGKVDMYGCTENRAFFGLDARHMQTARPALCGQMLRECAELFEQGFVKPIKTYMNVPAVDVVDAFRHMQKGAHIGKFIVNMRDDSSHLRVHTNQPSLRLQDNATYLLVGGLGGVGRSIASWFVRNGAKSLAFISRSGRSEKHEDFCKELEAMGCKIQVFQGSVANAEDVNRAVAEAYAPIRGVINLSMALQDRAIDNMAYEDWYTAIRPKVDGTWNLHHALSPDLDFFVLFSSTSGLVGQYGQANYASANTFLDAFVQYRHSQGLAASVIDLGVMEDVGYVAESSNLLDYFRFLDADLLTEDNMREGVRLAISRSFVTAQEQAIQKYSNPSQITLGVRSHIPLSDPKNRILWKRDRRFSVYRTIESTTPRLSTTDESLRTFLNQLASGGASNMGDDKAEYLAKEIGRILYGFMMKDPEDMKMDLPLSTLGLDSLVGIELRNWCRTQIGFDISILEIMQSTLGEMGRRALESLVSKYT
ncbi:polyketide synthase [Amniculicola lignicola CBS 123094]|uniref:Polyketide synthase n=1 Tax=Amniculicola lignicola CBS 123094 TaxID=1392246 RepID=A0A6A5VTX5_9PLEO|nr:polyketide synthase [Amniculicola lignicola CBS 123094]